MKPKAYNDWLLVWFFRYGLGPRTDKKLPIEFKVYSEKHNKHVTLSGMSQAIGYGHMGFKGNAMVLTRTGVEYINLLLKEMNDA